MTLLAAAKGYWQKNKGFDSTELSWLWAYGAQRMYCLLSSSMRISASVTASAATPFTIAMLASTPIFNTFAMKHPVEGKAVTMKDYFAGDAKTHLTCLLYTSRCV